MANPKTKTKGRKKLCRSARKKAYYENFRRRYESKKIRQRGKREKGLVANKNKLKKESPSDIRRKLRRRPLQVVYEQKHKTSEKVGT